MTLQDQDLVIPCTYQCLTWSTDDDASACSVVNTTVDSSASPALLAEQSKNPVLSKLKNEDLRTCRTSRTVVAGNFEPLCSTDSERSQRSSISVRSTGSTSSNADMKQVPFILPIRRSSAAHDEAAEKGLSRDRCHNVESTDHHDSPADTDKKSITTRRRVNSIGSSIRRRLSGASSSTALSGDCDSVFSDDSSVPYQASTPIPRVLRSSKHAKDQQHMCMPHNSSSSVRKTVKSIIHKTSSTVRGRSFGKIGLRGLVKDDSFSTAPESVHSSDHSVGELTVMTPNKATPSFSPLLLRHKSDLAAYYIEKMKSPAWDLSSSTRSFILRRKSDTAVVKEGDHEDEEEIASLPNELYDENKDRVDVIANDIITHFNLDLPSQDMQCTSFRKTEARDVKSSTSRSLKTNKEQSGNVCESAVKSIPRKSIQRKSTIARMDGLQGRLSSEVVIAKLHLGSAAMEALRQLRDQSSGAADRKKKRSTTEHMQYTEIYGIQVPDYTGYVSEAVTFFCKAVGVTDNLYKEFKSNSFQLLPRAA